MRDHPKVRTAAQAEVLSGYKVIELINKTGKAGLGPLSDKFHIRTCLVYKEKEHSDWVTNLLQGLGKETPAYEQALAFAKNCYERYNNKSGVFKNVCYNTRIQLNNPKAYKPIINDNIKKG